VSNSLNYEIELGLLLLKYNAEPNCQLLIFLNLDNFSFYLHLLADLDQKTQKNKIFSLKFSKIFYFGMHAKSNGRFLA
jgi:hypothetical protein